VPSIKFYVREGLLPSGTRARINQTVYSTAHLERLSLIRALLEVGDLSVPAVRRVLQAFDDRVGFSRAHFAMAIDALSDAERARRSPLSIDEGVLAQAQTDVADLMEDAGWRFRHAPAAQGDLAYAIATIRTVLDPDLSNKDLLPYVRLMENLSALEQRPVSRPMVSPTDALRIGFLRTVLYEPVILALRRLARRAHAPGRSKHQQQEHREREP
jgi:DNA-binding transcriptional MerR regulator